MTKQKELIIDCRMLHHSGIGRYIQELVTEIAPRFKTSLIVQPSDAAFAIKLNIPYIISDAPIYSIKEQLTYNKISAASAIFWSPHYNVPFLPFKCKSRIVTIHDVNHLAFSKELSLEKRLYAKLLIGKAVRHSNKVITVSEFSKAEIMRYTGCPDKKITVIQNGVKQTPLYNDETSVKEKYALPEKYILFVGNVKPHKNIKCLLDAYCRLNEELRKQFKVVVVGKKDGFITGDNALFQWMDGQPELKGSIYFTGFVDEEHLDTIYAAASLLVFPSFYEGFGLPPLEAMVNRCPVVSSKSSSMPEVCGDAVLYFDPCHPEDLKVQMEKVLTDKNLQENLKKKGALHATKFTWKSSIEEHISLLGSIG